MPDQFQPPEWLSLDSTAYRRLLNREAVAQTKRARRCGGTYRVREAMEAIDVAFHRCDGTDPYDGHALDPALVVVDHPRLAVASIGQQSDRRTYARLPTIASVRAESIAEFEIVSWQTKMAKGDLTSREFFAYCRNVVMQSEKISAPFKIDP